MTPSGKCFRCGSDLDKERQFQCETCDRLTHDFWREKLDRDEREATDFRLRSAGIPDVYRTGKRGLKDVPEIKFMHVLRICRAIGSEEIRGLFFAGPSRSFKTSIAASMLATGIRAGSDGRFVDVTDLMTDVQHSYRDDNAASRSAIVTRLSQTRLLVLDDLGQEKATHHAGEVLRQILDRRWRNWSPGRWTIVTSNFTAEQLRDRFEETQTGNAILHRIAALTVYVEMEAA